MRTSEVAILAAPHQIAMETRELAPTPADGLLIRISLAGICGTDYKHYTKGLAVWKYPTVMGHEIVGNVVDVGPDSPYDVAVGDQVVVDSFIHCPPGHGCADPRQCPDLRGYGGRVASDETPYLLGSYSQYMHVLPGSAVFKVAPDLDPRVGVLVCAVLGNAVRWLVGKGGLESGETVAIRGVGQQAMAAAILAKRNGARRVGVLGLSGDRQRLKVAAELGATDVFEVDVDGWRDDYDRAFPGGADLFLDAAGADNVLQETLGLTRRGGRIVLAALTGKGTSSIVTDDLADREISIHGVQSHDTESVVRALEIIDEVKDDLARIVTDVMPLSRAAEALEALGPAHRSETMIKIALDPWA